KLISQRRQQDQARFARLQTDILRNLVDVSSGEPAPRFSRQFLFDVLGSQLDAELIGLVAPNEKVDETIGARRTAEIKSVASIKVVARLLQQPRFLDQERTQLPQQATFGRFV